MRGHLETYVSLYTQNRTEQFVTAHAMNELSYHKWSRIPGRARGQISKHSCREYVSKLTQGTVKIIMVNHHTIAIDQNKLLGVFLK